MVTDKNGKDSSEFWEDGLEAYLTANILNWASEDCGSVTVSSDYTVNDDTYRIEYNFSYVVDDVHKELAALIKIQSRHSYIIGIKNGNVYFFGNQGNRGFNMVLRDYAPIIAIEDSLPIAADSLTSIMIRSLLKLGDNVIYGKNGKISEYIADVNFVGTLNKFKSSGKPAEELGPAQRALENIGAFIEYMSDTYFGTELTSLSSDDGVVALQYPVEDLKLNASYVMQGEKPLAEIESFYIDFYSPASSKRAFFGNEYKSSISFYVMKKNSFDGDVYSSIGDDDDYEAAFSLEEYKKCVQDVNVVMLTDAFLRIIDMLG